MSDDKQQSDLAEMREAAGPLDDDCIDLEQAIRDSRDRPSLERELAELRAELADWERSEIAETREQVSHWMREADRLRKEVEALKRDKAMLSGQLQSARQAYPRCIKLEAALREIVAMDGDDDPDAIITAIAIARAALEKEVG